MRPRLLLEITQDSLHFCVGFRLFLVCFLSHSFLPHASPSFRGLVVLALHDSAGPFFGSSIGRFIPWRFPLPGLQIFCVFFSSVHIGSPPLLHRLDFFFSSPLRSPIPIQLSPHALPPSHSWVPPETCIHVFFTQFCTLAFNASALLTACFRTR